MWNEIGDEGAKVFSEVLKTNSSLTELRLAVTESTSYSVATFVWEQNWGRWGDKHC